VRAGAARLLIETGRECGPFKVPVRDIRTG